MAALVVLGVGVLLAQRGGQDQATTAGELTSSQGGLAAGQLIASPPAGNDSASVSAGGERSVGAIADPETDGSSTRKTLVASTTEAPTTTVAPTTTQTTVKETTTTVADTTTTPPTTEPTTTEVTEPPTTVEPPVTITVPPISLPTITIPVPPPGEHSITPEDLQAARNRFAAMGYTSYQMTVSRSCFCLVEYLGPFEVVVRNGEIVKVTNLSGFDTDGGVAGRATLTVAGLFDYIAGGFDSAQMDVTFDAETGVPLSISIDRDFRMADDEMSITVSDFSPRR